ncbi:sigma-54 dependent transcriptional regulator [Niveibacterium sp. SC-1]|uniref:sigma-54 interaction domain-containing protein n=1 Tax=Niveibacterium sp. SC-1 TaxID=3135646 RepID=UPI00311F63D2
MDLAQPLRVFEDSAPRPAVGRNATSNARPLLTFPDPDAHVLSIRAKAMVFTDPASRRLLEEIERVAPTEATVLVIGETGTGKELVARHLHDKSRRDGPFVAINCGAFSENLVEAELFGHEAGAYTGAAQARPGWFEAAHGGTLFLDEIGDLPLSMQVKLLRVLQERQVVRLGSRKAVQVDVRLVAATNVDLARAVAAGHFRADLYYRLNVASLDLPPLRERRNEVLPLAEHFVERYRKKLGLEAVRISPEAAQILAAYEWPGNIRELENVVHYALIVCSQGLIQPQDLRLPGRPGAPAATPGAPAAELETVFKALLARNEPKLFDKVLHDLLHAASETTGFNQVQTAKRLGITRNVLRTYLKRYQLL